MRLKKITTRSFLCGLFYLLLIHLALSGCSLKYTGPQIVKDGVMFSVKAQNAKKVTIAGSFNQWDTEKDALAGPDGDGIWSIILPLADGRHQYIFIIDGGQWLMDPESPFADDGLGGRNSVISVRR